jgi:hypothetical protein
MSRHVKPYIRREGTKISTETPFSNEWVAAIKYCIPLAARQWTGEIWIFDVQYYTCVRDIVEHFFGTSYIDSTGGISEPQNTTWRERWSVFKDGKHQPGVKGQWTWDDIVGRETPRTQTEYSVLFVTPDAPPEVIKAAYRTLAMMYHPDKGGDKEKMVQLNAAYDRLKIIGRA